MKYTQTIRVFPFCIFLLMIPLCSGCSVFSTVGHAISQGYENTVTYFNIYYNARKLFDDVEAEVISDSLKEHTKLEYSAVSKKISEGARQRFSLVIDKCSNILAFHPSSALVDDALFLVGKSFFYQSEYLKAERKFEEILAQYPDSPLLLEVQLWYARTEEKLGTLDVCIRLSETVIASAQISGNDEIEIQARQLLAVCYRRMGQSDKAIGEYEKIKLISSDDAIRTGANIDIGDIYFFDANYEKANGSYLNAGKYTSDIYSNYYRKLQASIAYRKLGENGRGLQLLNEMAGDFRYKEYLPAILYERGNNYNTDGKFNEAINEYVYIDTAYAKKEHAIRSAYQLGLLYEDKFSDYKSALIYYSEVNSAADLDIVPDGRLKFWAITRYFDDRKMLVTADSIIAILKDTANRYTDTLSSSIPDSGKNADSISNASNNSSNRDLDSTQSKGKKTASLSLPRNIDSLQIIKSIAALDLGDIFYSEIKIPDSAFYWYNQGLAFSYDKNLSPRILYILGEISRTHPDQKYPSPEEYYKRLEHDFPGSMYMDEVRRLQGKMPAVARRDTAAEYYNTAEKLIDAKEYSKAIEMLKKIIRLYPKSPLAAKSEYAIGWLAEYRLEQPDTAIAHYKNVKERYAGTAFAAEALKRSLEIVQPDTVKKDTVRQDSTMTGRGKIQREIIDSLRKDTLNTGKPDISKELTKEELEKRNAEHGPDSTRTELMDDKDK